MLPNSNLKVVIPEVLFLQPQESTRQRDMFENVGNYVLTEVCLIVCMYCLLLVNYFSLLLCFDNIFMSKDVMIKKQVTSY